MSWQYYITNCEVKGKSCLITGGASRVGALCVEAFLKEGAKFVAILDADEEKGKALERKLTKYYPGKVAFLECNFDNDDSIANAFKNVVDKVYRIHVLVNNALNDAEAFLKPRGNVITMMAAVSLNLKAVQHMRRDRSGAGGTIINVVSQDALGLTASKFPKPNYRAADATIVHFSRALSEEYSRVGLRVMMISFGLIHSPELQSVLVPVDPSIAKSLKSIVGTTHWQRPESAAAAYVTMFKNGANGSVWISQKDDPAEDITESTIQRYY